MPHNPRMTQDTPGPGSGSAPDEAVAVFGTWRRVYAAALIWLAVVMAGIALFQRWAF